jgi:hypothetical protein
MDVGLFCLVRTKLFYKFCFRVFVFTAPASALCTHCKPLVLRWSSKLNTFFTLFFVVIFDPCYFRRKYIVRVAISPVKAAMPSTEPSVRKMANLASGLRPIDIILP